MRKVARRELIGRDDLTDLQGAAVVGAEVVVGQKLLMKGKPVVVDKDAESQNNGPTVGMAQDAGPEVGTAINALVAVIERQQAAMMTLWTETRAELVAERERATQVAAAASTELAPEVVTGTQVLATMITHLVANIGANAGKMSGT